MDAALHPLCFENDYGRLVMEAVCAPLSVSDIHSDLPVAQANRLPLETAEQIALISGNRTLQACMPMAWGGDVFIIYHPTPNTGVICRVVELDFRHGWNPADELAVMARSVLG